MPPIDAAKAEEKREELRQAALEYHEFPVPGKIAIAPTKQLINQHDLSLVTREHPAAGGRLLDVECEDRHGLQSKVRTGRR